MANASESGQSRKKILLVEDDDDVRDVTRFILSQMGLDVIEAETGNAALQILESTTQIDMLLSDIGLPGGMNGAQLVQKTWQIRPGMPILLVSAYDDDSLDQFGATTLNVTILRKPYPQEDLEMEVEKALSGK